MYHTRPACAPLWATSPAYSIYHVQVASCPQGPRRKLTPQSPVHAVALPVLNLSRMLWKIPFHRPPLARPSVRPVCALWETLRVEPNLVSHLKV